MVPINRRQFVAASGLVAIAGCLARGNEEEDDGGTADDALPESVAAVLDPVPTDVEGTELRQLYYGVPDPNESTDQSMVTPTGQGFGLDAESVDVALTGIYGEFEATVTVVTGDFAAEDVDEPERAAISVEDGRVLTASSRAAASEAGLEAAERAADDPDVGVDADAPVEALFGPMDGKEFVVGLLTVDDETIPEDASIDTEAVEAIALGRDGDLDAREETVTYVAVFADGETPDRSVIEEIVRTDDNEDVDPEEIDVETDDQRATTTFTRDLPQSRLPDNSPDVHVGIVTEQEEGEEDGTVSLYFTGDGPVDASNLEYLVDGEEAEPPWEEGTTIETQDRYEVDVPPMTHVAVLWVDPELDDVKQRLGGGVVGGHDAFEAEYDHDTGDLTIEYTVDRSLDADRFEVVEDGGNTASGNTTPLSEYVDTLEQGTEFVLTDVEYGEYVTIEMDLDDVAGQSSTTVFWYSADPPGHFRHERADDAHSLVFHGEQEVDAEQFQVLVDGEPADAQWSDVAETLSGDERLELDASVGDTVSVEYLGEDEPIEVFHRELRPTAEFEFDVHESTVEITHASGDSLDADAMAVELHPADDEGPREDAFDEYDTVEAGDSITVEYDGDEELEAVVVLHDGHMLDYTELGTEESASGQGSDAENDD